MSTVDAADDRTAYHYVNGRRVPLVRDEQVYVVRYRRSDRHADEEMSPRHRRFVFSDSEEIDYISNYRLKVYRADLRQSNLVGEEKKEVVKRLVGELNDERPVDYAAVAFRNVPEDRKDAFASGEEEADPEEYELMFVSNQFVVAFHPDVSSDWIEDLNAEFDVTIVKELGYVENGYLLRAPRGEGELGPVALANRYYETGKVEFATPDFVRKRHIRDSSTTQKRRVYQLASELGVSTSEVIDRLAEHGVYVKNNLSTVEEEVCQSLRADVSGREDRHTATTAPEERVSRTTYLDRQWHLDLSRARDAWELTEGDSSVRIAIIDDGVDVGHPEFVNKDIWQRDYDQNVKDGRPKLIDDNHGTACAGVAVAAGEKAYGAAPSCSLMAVRYPLYMGVAAEADMFEEVCRAGADVINCSWGPAKGRYLLTDNVRHAIDYCVDHGRVVDGTPRGIPIIWAAGNDEESVDTDGYAAYEKVIAVAASTSEDTHAWYSEYGDAIWVAAPSSGGDRAIFTTDRQSSAGYNVGTTDDGDAVGNYYDAFGGTSSAAPLVAGIVGLMLTVNPQLTQPEVKEILAKTAEKIGGVTYAVDPDDPIGEPRHDEFGYGRVDAYRAVNAALDGLEQPETTPTIEPVGEGPFNRADTPPQFSVDLASNAVYVVEVATRAELFDDATHGAERSLDNFYPVWTEESPDYQSASTFTLPEAVWARLEETEKLYYRMHSASSTAAGWPGYHVTTPDTDAASAPSIDVSDTGGRPSEDTEESTEPSIEPVGEGPFNRADTPPQFSVDLASNAVYVVEVATRAELFDDATHGAERSLDNFYPVWSEESADYQSASTFTLPEDVWTRLEETEKLYYRMHSASSTAAGWPGYHVTTPDTDAASAPFVHVSGRRPRGNRTDRSPQKGTERSGYSPASD